MTSRTKLAILKLSFWYNEFSFCIAQVELTRENTYGVLASLKVHWLHAKEEIFDSTCNLSFAMWTRKIRSPWLKTIPTESITLTVGSLTANNRLPAAVQKKNARSFWASCLNHHTPFLNTNEKKDCKITLLTKRMTCYWSRDTWKVTERCSKDGMILKTTKFGVRVSRKVGRMSNIKKKRRGWKLKRCKTSDEGEDFQGEVQQNGYIRTFLGWNGRSHCRNEKPIPAVKISNCFQ